MNVLVDAIEQLHVMVRAVADVAVVALMWIGIGLVVAFIVLGLIRRWVLVIRRAVSTAPLKRMLLTRELDDVRQVTKILVPLQALLLGFVLATRSDGRVEQVLQETALIVLVLAVIYAALSAGLFLSRKRQHGNSAKNGGAAGPV